MLGTQIGLNSESKENEPLTIKCKSLAYLVSPWGNHDCTEKGTGNDSLGMLAFCPKVRGIFILH